MALGKLFEGAAWFATLSLATVGTLAFLPDGAWETFPTALRPARAKLAEFGVAPSRYRADLNAEEGGKIALNALNKETTRGEGNVGPEDDWQAAANVRIGERWKDGRSVEETAFVDRRNGEDASPSGTEDRTRNGGGETETGAETAWGIVSNVENWGNGEDGGNGEGEGGGVKGGAALGDAANVAATSESASVEPWELDAIPPFVEEPNAPEVANDALNVEEKTDFPVLEEVEPSAVVAGTNGNGGDGFNGTSEVDDSANFNGGAGVSGANGVGASSGLLEQADAALANELSVEAVATPLDENAELQNALAAASTASTPEEIKTVFEALNRIRNERGVRLAAEDSRALDAALDRLAFDVFYNPAQAVLEPLWQTAPGESLASIAERLGTTPETLAEINGLKTPVDAPLPVGTTLKTVRGPVSAEISVAKRELTLQFNGLYAGRFALGVPENSANMRGVFRVVEKLTNPNCDAVDANGQTISIPGGAPENPLGVAWVALDGGVGLQGTNRPELVGQLIPENGGFVFSNREIAQLSVLLPIGAEVAIVD